MGPSRYRATQRPSNSKTVVRASVPWVRIPPPPPRLQRLILQCFSGLRRCGIRDSSRGFRATVHRPHGPVRPMSPVCGAPISRISLSAVRVVRFARRRRDVHRVPERDRPPPVGGEGRWRCCEEGAVQMKPSPARCSCQSIGARVSAISLWALRSAGWRPWRIARVMSGARKLSRNIRVK